MAPLLLALIASIAVATTLLVVFRPTNFFWSLIRRRLSLQPVSSIVDLRIYPIKSCRGFSVREAVLQQHGLDLDRQWMFVDAEKREFLTIRQLPKMTLVNTALSPDAQRIEISVAEGGISLSIDARPNDQWLSERSTILVKIWDTETDAYAYGPEINNLFSSFFGREVFLVYKGPTPRILGGNGAPGRIGRTQSTYFPDVLPVQIASEASLHDLNFRLEERGSARITIERFRPNIIIKGSKPWVEDSWKTVQISKPSGTVSKNSPCVRLDVVARCARCQVPNVNPDTASKDKKEPWNTLMSFRRVDPGITFKPCFGMLSVPRNEGLIHVGMDFNVLEETDAHQYVAGF